MSLPATHHYIDAFMAAVPTTKQAAYRQHVTEMAPLFKQHGALQVVECWGDDIPEGKLTSMPMAVQCQADETVVFSWVVWPSKAVRDAGWAAIMADPRTPKDMPFDGKRLIHGGFVPLLVD